MPSRLEVEERLPQPLRLEVADLLRSFEGDGGERLQVGEVAHVG